MAKSIHIDHVYKVFGNKPEQAITMAKQGKSKQDILEKTGQSIGVYDAHFSIEAGEIFVIMGLSGSGKSTLVRMLNRLIEPSAGKIVVDGQDINALSDKALRNLRRKDISMVFQSFALMPHMTVLDNTAFGLELAGIDKNERHQAAQAALEQVGLGAWGNSYPDELSGGMQQRVGLARALAADPAILLMDEAFSALDPIIRTDMQSELLRLQEVKQRTIVFISHDLDEAMRIGNRIAIMKDGHVVQVGTPEEILRNPANDYVRSFTKGVDASVVFKVADIASRNQPVLDLNKPGKGLRAALRILEDQDRDYGYVVSRGQRFEGIVSTESLRQARNGSNNLQPLSDAFLPDPITVRGDELVADVVGRAAQPRYPLPVVNEEGVLLGVVSRTRLLRFLDRDTPPLPVESTRIDTPSSPPNAEAAPMSATV
ncbi:glycine betaine/L-proline ABC transporter ATP-binding protein ProV [Lampropedia puyangensis]|uniref:Quaternary amine transport ATP-binding protein n=1 Tax=Lampropedia puyangensis TaxID=1330072 RepID=A0A4S8EVM2_9BURK|nr:glycine betaine/L-proline ABC transporter ATP-binding protein ProV [Lampropedia puyangensis]THT97824.1 glycine betaine/L-proline ABC transporter ATP-binding protein ProV [Lampropedia puyangensis]